MKLNGLDAWRIIIRMIDSGMDHQLERLREEVRAINKKPIKDLEHVATGIAEYEAKVLEFKEAGGVGFPCSQEMKSDMRKILPTGLREDLIWMDTGKQTFEEFRDKILEKSAEILFSRRQDGVHAVAEEPQSSPANPGWDKEFECAPCGVHFEQGVTVNSMDDLVALVNRVKGRGKGASAAGGAAARPPRKCHNCGQTHDGKCTAPEIPREKRPCWTCGKPGCISATCPLKPKGGKAGGKGGSNRSAVKAIEDALPFFGLQDGQGPGVQAAVTDGFQMAKKTFKPTPTRASLSDFVKPVDRNTFGVLIKDRQRYNNTTSTATGSSSADLRSRGRDP